MSTIKVNTLRHTDATSGGISLDSSNNATTSGNLTVTGSATLNGVAYPSAGPLSNRNLIVNGGMAVAQRGTSGTGSGYYSIDRFRTSYSSVTVGQSQITLTSGDPYDEGFRYAFRATNSSTSSSIYGFSQLSYYVEAQDLAQSGWNYTSSSSYITCSFWVRCSLAGTYYMQYRGHDTSNFLQIVKSFTVSADTWTKVTHTIPGNASMVINNDNGRGLELAFTTFYGSYYQDSNVSLDTWYSASGGNNFVPGFDQDWNNTASATFDITGVQLEVGSVATPFEHRSYGDELARCKRYYEKSYPQGTNPGSVYGVAGTAYVSRTNLYRTFEPFTVEKRATPTVVIYSPDTGTADKIRNVSSDADVTAVTDAHSPIGVRIGSNSGGDGDLLRWHWTATAEL